MGRFCSAVRSIDLVRVNPLSDWLGELNLTNPPPGLASNLVHDKTPKRISYVPRALECPCSIRLCIGSPPAAKGSESATVVAVNISYSPETLEIERGTEVTWSNEDEGVHHTVTSGLPGDNGVPGVSKGKPPKHDGVFDGDLPDTSARFTYAFDEPGTYAYFCRIHPSMTGEVIVR